MFQGINDNHGLAIGDVYLNHLIGADVDWTGLFNDYFCHAGADVGADSIADPGSDALKNLVEPLTK